MKKKLIFLGLTGVFIFAVYFFLANLNKPKTSLSEKEKIAALTKTLGRTPILKEEQGPLGDSDYKNKYISFRFPAKAKIYKYRQEGFDKDKFTLDYLSFDMENPRLIFNFTVIDAFNLQTVSDYPSVRLRENQKGTYIETKFELKSKEGVLFTKKDRDAEKTLFILSEGKLYTFLVTGSDFEEVEKLFDKIISTVSFP